METEEARGGQIEILGAASEPRRLPSKRRIHSEQRKLNEVRQHVRQLRRRFAACAGVLSLLSIALGAWALRETHQHRALTATLYKEKSEIAEARQALEQARADLDALVKGRIPELTPVAFDEVLPIGKAYVRNVAFTLVRAGSDSSYEYKVVLQNETDIMVRPAAEILMFDRLGVQIGRARIGPAPDAGGDDPQFLYPGEVRSYAGAMELSRRAEPAYFTVETR